MCRIVNAEYAGDYKVLITFSDGQKRLADFYDFMAQSEANLKPWIVLIWLMLKLFVWFKY